MVGYDDSVPMWLRTTAGWSWRIIAVALAVALAFYAMSQVQLVFVSVFIALVLTSVLRPVTDFYARIMPRSLATGLALITALAFVGGLLTYVIASVAGQWMALSEQFTRGINEILSYLKGSPFHIDVTTEDLNQWIETARIWIGQHGGDIASRALASAGSVIQGFAGFALAIFCTVFFVARGDRLWTWFLNQLPARSRDTWKIAGGAGWYTFSGYARGTVIIALTDSILVGIFLAILGVPLAAPLAVLVFIGAFIPIIGAPLAMIVAAVVALAADGLWTALIVTLGIAGIGQFEGHVLQPLIMGKQVSLHPVVVAVAVTAGTIMAGILGAIVAVPIVAVTWAVYSKLHHKDPPMDGPPPTAREVMLGDGAD